MLGLLLFAYSVVRSSLVCLTVDEAFTFIAYVKRGMFFPEEYTSLTANFHMLNTWLMIVSMKLFGSAEWAIRLPNVLAHALYLFFTARFALKNSSGWTAAGIFILLNVHPYLLDFFSVARGYGLSLGLLAGALWHLSKYTTEQKKQKHLLLSLLFAGLSMWASFVTLHAFLGITFVLFCLTVFDTQLLTKEKLKRAGFAFVLFAAFFAVAFPVMLKMQKADAFYWGQKELWNGTLCGLGGLLSYTVDGNIHLYQRAEDGWVAVVLLLSFALLLYALVKNRKQPFLRNETTVLCALLFVGAIAVVAQHVLLGSPYPAGRTFLWMFVIFLWAICSAIRSVNIPAVLQRTAIACAVGFQLFFAIPDFNLAHAEEWQYCENVDEAIDLLATYMRSGAESHPAVTMAADPQYGNIVAYYLQQKGIHNISVVNTSGAYEVRADYYLISPHEQHAIPFTDTVMVYRSSALVLLKNRILTNYTPIGNTPNNGNASKFVIDSPDSRAELLVYTFEGTDTAEVRMNMAASIAFANPNSAGVFQYWHDRNDTNIWSGYAVCEADCDSTTAVYKVARFLPVPFAPGDVFKIHFVPFEDPKGTIEISQFQAQLQFNR